MRIQRAIVLGVHSFLGHGVKVGSQYIAEGLAENGWEVDYISVPSSPFDIYGRERRKRLRRVWNGCQDIKGIVIKPNLNEYAFRTPYPFHKLFLRSYHLLDGYSRWAPEWLKCRQYDICIHDITANILFLHLIRAEHLVLRLNDPPNGFSFHIHQKLVDRFEEKISSLVYKEIWAVSEPLASYALQLNPANNVIVLPNGIEDRFLTLFDKGRHRPKTAIYLGSISPWVDLELIEQTAQLLPEWQFHFYGPLSRPWTPCANNVKRFEPVQREVVPELLADYQVGLIPFRDACGRLNYVERPLKFYEYIGAGLGIASTDFGTLKKGMKDLVTYGNTPHGFAQAIIQAAKNRAMRPDAFNRTFIEEHSWKNIVQNMCKRIAMFKTGAYSSKKVVAP